MHQITSGEIHKKNKIFNSDIVLDFLKDNYLKFKTMRNLSNCIYRHDLIVNDKSFNFLNLSQKKEHKPLIEILKKEFNDCENLYPNLGNYFLDCFFDCCDYGRQSKLFFSKKNINDFIENSLSDISIKEIAKYIFENCSMEYSVSVEETISKQFIIKKDNCHVISAKFDSIFLENNSFVKIKNYRFVVYDGFIQNVSEIHHLLESSSKEKVPYLIFCKGMSQDVKKTIMINNRKKIIDVHPVSFAIDEKSLNIMHDIAVLHDSDVINIFNGSTISKEVINNKKIGKEIILSKNKIELIPLCSSQSIFSHKNFLKNRLEGSKNLENKKLIVERIKSFNAKTIKIYMPKNSIRAQIRELDYFLRFVQNIEKPMIKIKKFENATYYVPKLYVNYAKEKSKKTKNIFENIEKLIIVSEKNERRN